MPPMQRLMSVSKFIIVLDIVVDERGFVKSFHRHGDSTDGVRKHDSLILPGGDRLVFSQGIESRQCDEGPKSFASFDQPVVSNSFRSRDGIARVICCAVLWLAA